MRPIVQTTHSTNSRAWHFISHGALQRRLDGDNGGSFLKGGNCASIRDALTRLTVSWTNRHQSDVASESDYLVSELHLVAITVRGVGFDIADCSAVCYICWRSCEANRTCARCCLLCRASRSNQCECEQRSRPLPSFLAIEPCHSTSRHLTSKLSGRPQTHQHARQMVQTTHSTNSRA